MLVSKNTKLSVAIIGDSGVGKSAIMNRQIAHKFEDAYSSTIEDFFTTMVKRTVAPVKSDSQIENTTTAHTEDQWLELDIVDTAGMDELKKVRDTAIKDKDAYIFVYSLTSKQSILKLHEFLGQIQRCHSSL